MEKPAIEDDADPLAVKFGVGGTQAMIAILTSDELTDEQKINILVELFGLSEEQAEKMLDGGIEDVEESDSENAGEDDSEKADAESDE